MQEQLTNESSGTGENTPIADTKLLKSFEEEGVYTRPFIVTPDYCDSRASLSPLGVFAAFQALSAEHAQILGIGAADMKKKGKIWVTVHNRIDFYDTAWLVDELTASTWAVPCAPESERVFRAYSLQKGDRRIAEGKTQWAFLGMDGKTLPFKDSGFPSDYKFVQRQTIPDEPVWFEDDFTQEDLSEVYQVRPTDVDFGHHMNNIIYVRRLLDQFSSREITAASVRSIEIHYGAPCKEKETIHIYKKTEDHISRMAMKKEDGRTAAMGSIWFH